MGGVDRPIAVALGSNLGDRRAHLDYAVERLGAFLRALRVSTFHETAPVGVGDQPWFLNAAAVGLSPEPASSILDRLLGVERERGRARPFPGAPRTLDLDLILCGTEVASGPELQLPHPRFRERLFVLGPLSEIAPDLVDPVTGLPVSSLFEGAGGNPRPLTSASRHPR